jgi:hypothetical protein
MPSFRFVLSAVLTFALLLVCAPLASAAIVVGQGMAGVKLDQTEAEVQAVLGTPIYKAPYETPEGKVTSWGYPNTLMGRVGFDASGHVTGLWTSSRKEKTSKGISPGASLTKLRQAYPKAKCQTGPFGPKSVVCVLKSKFEGKTVETIFPFFTRTMGLREVDIDFS